MKLRVSYNEVCNLLNSDRLWKSGSEMFKELLALAVFDWMDDPKWQNACTKHEQHLVPLLEPLLHVLKVKFRKRLINSTKNLVFYVF